MDYDLLFMELTILAERLGVSNASARYPGCWEHRTGEWLLALNPHETTRTTSTGRTVDPYHCHVERDGVPVGWFNPRRRAMSDDDATDLLTHLLAESMLAGDPGAVTP